MTPADLVVRGRRVVTPEGVREAAVVVRGGRIEALTALADTPEARETIDAGELIVMPGLVDTHVHERIRLTAWAGFATATRRPRLV
jgi:allantoinase